MTDWPTLLDDNGEAYQHGYFEGQRVGIERFSWWKDGVQYVGTCGMTLKDALAEIDAREREARGLSEGERECR